MTASHQHQHQHAIAWAESTLKTKNFDLQGAQPRQEM